MVESSDIVSKVIRRSRVVISTILLFISVSSSASDILKVTDSLNFNQTLISSEKKYETGFFIPPGAESDKIYLGIWYYNLTVPNTIVWVANRNIPANSSSDVVLKFRSVGSGQIAITQQGVGIWSSNKSMNVANPVLQLLDTGNLVVREANSAEISYGRALIIQLILSCPTRNLDGIKRLDRRLISWKSTSDPTLGDYSFMLNLTGDPEAFLLKGMTEKIYRSGPWIGQGMSGVPAMRASTEMNYTLLDTLNEVYYMFVLVDLSIRSRLVVAPGGFLYRYTWMPNSQQWNQFWYAPMDPCDRYMTCGPYGVCDASNLFVCECPQGFVPKDPVEWGLRDGYGGCLRQTELECAADGFVLLRNMKLPMSGSAVVDRQKSLKDCLEECKKDCNCTAYSNAEVVDGVGSGYVTWTDDLLDMRSFKEGGQDLYVRLAAADLNGSNKTKKAIIGIGVSVAAATILLSIVISIAWRAKHKTSANRDQSASRSGTGDVSLITRPTNHNSSADDPELPFYDFDAIVTATNDFSDENKLGQGGFGCVFKGVMMNTGEEIAVKRLSKESGQGVEEFKNEVNVIAKLQHRNLVRLLGYSMDGDEKMLIYEYLRNRSLDYVLFHKHKERCLLLTWERRFNIICGIARGLLYLHHDSRLRIIHRDLKASNILLDDDFNPKISDFGMARIFKGDETDANNTKRVVGTYGYMSPEYAMEGIFSTKSDVFSFGVLVLEIVMGKKNREFSSFHQELSLLGYAWKMWAEGKATKLMDPSLEDSYRRHEVLKCIQIGLLCGQAQPKERPTMSSVVSLLSNEDVPLPQPKLPGFYVGWRPICETNSNPSQDSFTENALSVTTIDGR